MGKFMWARFTNKRALALRGLLGDKFEDQESGLSASLTWEQDRLVFQPSQDIQGLVFGTLFFQGLGELMEFGDQDGSWDSLRDGTLADELTLTDFFYGKALDLTEGLDHLEVESLRARVKQALQTHF